MLDSVDYQIKLLAIAQRLPEVRSMPRREFVEWLTDNYEIYQHFRHFAREALRAKRARFSAYMIRERVRWYTMMEYDTPYKISNNLTPYIARLLAEETPALQAVFSFKDWRPLDPPSRNYELPL